MSSKKNKKQNPPPAEKKPAEAYTKETPPAPPTGAPPEQLDDGAGEQLEEAPPPARPEWSPTEQLLDISFNVWAAEFLRPCFQMMTRTFAHHRLKEQYDTNKVFHQLMLLNRGKHGELLEELGAFRQTLFDDLKAMLARKGDTA